MRREGGERERERERERAIDRESESCSQTFLGGRHVWGDQQGIFGGMGFA